ncbi:GroES (chaperonin 10)-like protein [Amanita muscaria]
MDASGPFNLILYHPNLHLIPAPSKERPLYCETQNLSLKSKPSTLPNLGISRIGWCPGEILVKIKAVSLNPLDWKIQIFDFYVKSYPTIVGTDPAGDVEELGEGVTGVSVGDRVCFGKQEGQFSTVCNYKGRRLWLKNFPYFPIDSLQIGYEEVATFPCAGGAAYCGLFDSLPYGLGIPNPLAGPIQFAKLAGFSTVIEHTSVQHAEHLESIGATHVVNREWPNQK